MERKKRTRDVDVADGDAQSPIKRKKCGPHDSLTVSCHRQQHGVAEERNETENETQTEDESDNDTPTHAVSKKQKKGPPAVIPEGLDEILKAWNRIHGLELHHSDFVTMDVWKSKKSNVLRKTIMSSWWRNKCTKPTKPRSRSSPQSDTEENQQVVSGSPTVHIEGKRTSPSEKTAPRTPSSATPLKTTSAAIGEHHQEKGTVERPGNRMGPRIQPPPDGLIRWYNGAYANACKLVSGRHYRPCIELSNNTWYELTNKQRHELNGRYARYCREMSEKGQEA